MRSLILPADITRVATLKTDGEVLRNNGIETAQRDARLLMLAAAGISHADLLSAPRQPLGEETAQRLTQWIHQRLDRVPVARILGEWEFWSLPFKLAPETLVPRPDSETVVAAALINLGERRHQSDGLRILDLGTGSGCLLVALLHELPGATGLGVDLSEEALAMAAINARRNHIGERASFLRSDWHEAIEGSFDLIVSNPPYIADAVIDTLEPEVRLHDPRLALSGGHDGLQAYHQLMDGLPRLLAPDGVAVLEIGSDQSETVAKLASDRGFHLEGPYADFGARPRAFALRVKSGS
jgi:release factor glutamine methyltransferase